YETYRVADSVKTTGGYAYPNKWRSFVYTTDPNLPGRQKMSAVKTNYAYWRLSDIYLLRAECYVKTGQDGLAQSDLNRVRSNANAIAYPGGRDDSRGLQYAIFHEREREFLMEGHRFFDVIRNGMEYINKELKGAFTTMTLTDVKNGAIFLPIDDAFELNGLLRQNVLVPFMN
ncbi:MAG: RagB/SusD family nutrient uptake outer membrane protein, partial [Butyricimonas faecihominis]